MMKLVVSHVGGRSKAVADQNKILGDNEYNFSIRNTDKHGKAMGTAKNIHLNVKLPRGAQLQDAYFYTEAGGHKKPQSLSCKLEQGDGSIARCLLLHRGRGTQKATVTELQARAG